MPADFDEPELPDSDLEPLFPLSLDFDDFDASESEDLESEPSDEDFPEADRLSVLRNRIP